MEEEESGGIVEKVTPETMSLFSKAVVSAMEEMYFFHSDYIRIEPRIFSSFAKRFIGHWRVELRLEAEKKDRPKKNRKKKTKSIE